MSTFIMFGKYSHDSVREISKDRTRHVVEMIQETGGEIRAIYAVLGAYDLVMIVNYPTMEEVLRISVLVSQTFGISFSTLPAIAVEEFDELISKPS